MHKKNNYKSSDYIIETTCKSKYYIPPGAGVDNQRSAFEQNVMSTLEALKESMNQLKGNPSITQTEVNTLVLQLYNEGVYMHHL